jgi:hypothetical protein
MWISRPREYPVKKGYHPIGNLFLLEAFSRDDKQPLSVSSYSALLAFMLALDEDLEERFAWADEVQRTWDLDAELEKRLATEPLALLRRLGATIGATRKVTSLFRIRMTFNNEYSKPRFAYTTIGYPIVLAEAGGLRV